jgi:hypothetical protein
MDKLTTPTTFQIRYKDLFNGGRSLAFPCDARGRVDVDRLSDRARANYFYARAMVGREYAAPAIEAPARCH